MCRRCGLEEITDWYVVPGGRAVEITTWVAPTGAVLGALPVDSHQAPPRWQALEILETVADPPPRELLVWCPGDPRAWERAG